MEEGDIGDDRFGEVLPHPYCDFCEEFFFNDQTFFDHLNRQHLTCHLCSHHHKNVYYDEYANLEKHFALSHFICPYEACKTKCYVAFKTEDELRAHLDIVHNFQKQGGGKMVNANALLGFKAADLKAQEAVEEDEDKPRGKHEKKR